MKTKLFFIALLTLSVQILFAQKFEWAKKASGTAKDQGNGSCVDIFGNVYVTGTTNSTDFTTTTGSFRSNNAGK